MPTLPEARITIFSDYICPFCYVGNARINRLRQEFDIKINWRFVEIHPETPDAGHDVSNLQYDHKTWIEMMRNLDALLQEESLEMNPNRLVANSHYALRLAEACKTEGATIFYALHETLFRAYFVDGINIGDIQALGNIARDCGVSDSLLTRVFDDDQYDRFLANNIRFAAEAGVRGVPSMKIGDQMLRGMNPIEVIRDAIRVA